MANGVRITSRCGASRCCEEPKDAVQEKHKTSHASAVASSGGDAGGDELGDSEKLAFLLELGSELASVEAAASLKLELANVHTALEVVVADNAEIKMLLHEILDNKRANDKRTNELLDRYGKTRWGKKPEEPPPVVSWTGINPTARSTLSVDRPPVARPPDNREALFAPRTAPATLPVESQSIAPRQEMMGDAVAQETMVDAVAEETTGDAVAPVERASPFKERILGANFGEWRR